MWWCCSGRCVACRLKMEVDEALSRLGTVGRWQILYYTMISTACMVPTCFHMLANNYIG